MIKKKSISGVTFIELLVVIGVIVILIAISAPVFIFFQKKSELDNNTEEIINIIRTAQNKTLASEGASQYGVYFNIASFPNQYILFKGSSFASRDFSFDKINQLPKTIEIYEINLNGGSEAVFERLSGNTTKSGSLSLRLKNDPSETKTIYIENSGQIGLNSLSVSSDENRMKDSRHLHFDYSRVINTASESLILNFNTTTKDIPIASNLKDGQIYWEGEVEVEGEIQKLNIHTHRLNNLDTQFCIHRDRRYNSKPLIITISGDGSGNLVEYSADGLTTISNSFYVNNLNWQ